jgi:hypothetical protein
MRKLVLTTAAIASFAFALSPRPAHAQGGDLVPPPPVAQPGAPGQPSPPGASGQPAPRNDTEADLQKGEKEDSGLGLEWVYLNADAGFSYLDLKSFSQTDLALTDTSKSGLAYGFAAGVRLLFLSLGLRARNHTAMNLWQINADIGLHMKVSRVDAYLAVRGGYDTVGSLNQSVSVATNGGTTLPNSGIDVHGWNAGLAFGLDFYLAHIISIGAEAAGDVLFLKRPPAPLPAAVAALPQAQQDALKAQPLYQSSGSSVGFAGTLTGHVGIHF